MLTQNPARHVKHVAAKGPSSNNQLATLLGQRPKAPPLGQQRSSTTMLPGQQRSGTALLGQLRSSTALLGKCSKGTLDVFSTTPSSFRRWAATNPALAVEDFSIPSRFVAMPPILESDFEWQAVPQLVSQATKAALVWSVQHEPYWEALLVKLNTHKEDLRWLDAARLLLVFSKLDVVHPELLEHCEEVLLEQGGDLLLEMKMPELMQLGQALAKMKRRRSLSAVLRSLATRAHRVEARAVADLLLASTETWKLGDSPSTADPEEEPERLEVLSAAGDLLEAVLTSILEHETAHPLTLVTLAEVAGLVAQSAPDRLQSRGWKRVVPQLFRHLSQRLQEEKSMPHPPSPSSQKASAAAPAGGKTKENTASSSPPPSPKLLSSLLDRIVAAGHQTGCLTPLLQAEADVQRMRANG